MVELMPRLSRFLRDQKGAVTIEFTTLVPFFVMLLVFFADASTIYLTHSEMFEATRDISRRMATGELTTEEQVRDYATQKLFLGSRTYTVDADFGGEVRLGIKTRVADAAIFGGWFIPVIGRWLLAEVVLSREPRLVQEN